MKPQREKKKKWRIGQAAISEKVSRKKKGGKDRVRQRGVEQKKRREPRRKRVATDKL